MSVKAICSYFVAISIGLLAVAPHIPYNIPMMVNSFNWLYLVVAAGLFGFFLFQTRLHVAIKILMVYLYANCFISQAPAFSFNAYILLVLTVYFFLLCQKCDFSIIIRMVEAVFWFQCLLLFFQYYGMDTLMSFQLNPEMKELFASFGISTDDIKTKVFFGTIFQPMRLGSLFAVMSPLLLLKSKWYIVPLLITSVLSGTLGFSFALIVGILIYAAFKLPNKKLIAPLVALALTFGTFCTLYNSEDAFRVAITEGRVPVWIVALKSWALDTTGPSGSPDIFGISQTGPVDLKRVAFGHGMDTFLPLFPIYKHDPNPFPQAHSDPIQILWETGLIGFCILFFWYFADIIRRLALRKEHFLLAGLAIIFVNSCFAFPSRMTQSLMMMIVYFSFCDVASRKPITEVKYREVVT